MKMVLLVIYGRDWPAFSQNLRSPLEILVANVGHGDCTGIFGSKNSLLIDFGTKKVKKYAGVVDYVKWLVDAKDERKLVISHYHSDHYSLLKRLPSHYFHELYLPALPPKTNIGSTLLEAIALFIALRYHRYFLVPEILRTSRRIRPMVRGDQFTATNLNWEVMWPDYRLLEQTPRVHNVVGRLRNRISEVLAELSEEQRRYFDRIYEELSTSFAPESIPNYRESVWENVTEEHQPYNLM